MKKNKQPVQKKQEAKPSPPVDFNYYLELFKEEKIDEPEVSVMNFCERHNLPYYQFRRRLNKDVGVMQIIKDEVRKRYGFELLDIDAALIKKAKSGSEKAAELAYKRFENWNVQEGKGTDTNIILVIPSVMLTKDQRPKDGEEKVIELSSSGKQEIEGELPSTFETREEWKLIKDKG